MADREDLDALMNAIDEQVGFDLGKMQVRRVAFEGRAFTLNELLDIWNKEDLPKS